MADKLATGRRSSDPARPPEPVHTGVPAEAALSGGGDRLPELIRPMFAVPGPLPVPDENYGFEMKWDGVRAVLYVRDGSPKVLGRNHRNATAAYPELAPLATLFGSRSVILDGEVVAFDSEGRPSFAALQQRMHVRDAAAARRLAASVPVTYLAFDVLHLDGATTLELPYTDRRALLESLELSGPHWQTPPFFRGDGPAVLEASRSTGLEGVVAKRLDSTYLPGRRSDCWVKTKNLRHQSVVVCGFKGGTGRRGLTLGSLLLGVRDVPGGPLVFAGHVGTGFTNAMLTELRVRLDARSIADSPFPAGVPREHARDATWVRPELVGEVAFAEWTADGRLRHPAWRGLRPEIDPAEVTREP
ncbi:MAG: non-homologous end-joining DNA ligase [Actinomycetota bacterium]|nr:non-homologous end-joining DNA ligase [Actinomycetota bacterium]